MKSVSKPQRSSAKKHSAKQSSILSFFSATPGPAPSPSPLPSKPARNTSRKLTSKSVRKVGSSSTTPKRQTPVAEDTEDTHTPSTTVDSEPRVFSTRSRAAENRAQKKDQCSEEDELRRELFLDADEEEEPVRVKRKRKQNLIRPDSDDESDKPSPVSQHYTPAKIAHQFNLKSRSLVASLESPPSKKRQRTDSDVYIPDEAELQQANLELESPDTGLDKHLSQSDDDVPIVAMGKTKSGRLDIDSLRSKAPAGQSNIPAPMSELRIKARNKFGEMDANSRAVGNEEGGWCQKHSWSTNVLDAKKRKPDDPAYDKSTLFVPASVINETRGTKYGGLSPFQRQFWMIKKANYDVIIFFKKGKFYEMYDVDADVVHKELGLNYTKGGRVDMRCCGVPEQALEKHCARLIDMGYKVGRVEQTETAAALEKRRSSSGSKSSVCERTLVRIMTRATITEDGVLRDHNARYVLAVVEEQVDMAMPDSDQSTSVEDGFDSSQDNKSRTIGVCYVDAASGKITISQYKDDVRLSKTERLLMFLRPHELITDLSIASARLKNIVKWATRKSGADLINLAPKGGFKPMKEVTLAKYLKSSGSGAEKADMYQRVCAHMERFPLSCNAFGAIGAYLKSLIIDVDTLSLGNYILFPDPSSKENSESSDGDKMIHVTKSSDTRLRLDAPTLENLEVLSSSIYDSAQGALLSFVDRARTPAGRRLIRKWLAEPLVSSSEINDRLQAIEDIHNIESMDGGRTLQSLLRQMKTKKDLERALPRLHRKATVKDTAVMFDDTNKRLVKSFVSVIRGLHDSLGALETLAEALDTSGAKCARLKELCALGSVVPADALDKLNYFMGEAFDLDRAETGGEIVPKKGAIPSYDSSREHLDEVEHLLSEELRKWQKVLGDRSIKFYHRGKEPYQMEVKLDTIRRIPNEFEVVSESKVAKRFYTRRIVQLVRDQVEASEAFEDASSSVARDMMGQFDQEYATWSAVASACAEVDALIGLAFASLDEGSGPMCRPQIVDNDHPTATLKAVGLRHPILAGDTDSFVSNDISLGEASDTDIMILTGPNAGGKSTLARQVALAVILAQTGCYVPAESFMLRPFEDIFVRMGASDDLARGRSTFMVEMEEVSNILNNATSKSLVIADEVGRGTSTHDGYAVAYAALDHIAKVNKCLTIFSTHYSHLGEDILTLGEQSDRLRAGIYEMAAEVNEKKKKITFLYKVRQGSSGHSRGIYCARVAGLGSSVADDAEKAAQWFGKTFSESLERMQFHNMSRILGMDVMTASRLLQR